MNKAWLFGELGSAANALAIVVAGGVVVAVALTHVIAGGKRGKEVIPSWNSKS